MKALFLIALVVLSLPLRADILANGDFADGTAHWHGDGHDVDGGGIVVQLDPVKWTTVSQTFDTQETLLDFTVSFQTTSDFAFSQGGAFLSPRGIAQITGKLSKSGIKLKPGTWLLMVVDPSGGDIQYSRVPVKAGMSDVQTVNGSVPSLVAHEEKTLYLVFPPGLGTITLRDIALQPRGASGADNSPAN